MFIPRFRSIFILSLNISGIPDVLVLTHLSTTYDPHTCFLFWPNSATVFPIVKSDPISPILDLYKTPLRENQTKN